MATEIRELLPIGSVILLKEGTKRLMIYGIKQQADGVEYDYIGVLYPEGNIGDDHHWLFNHEDIDKIFFVGMNDSERQGFIAGVEAYYNALENKQKSNKIKTDLGSEAF